MNSHFAMGYAVGHWLAGFIGCVISVIIHSKTLSIISAIQMMAGMIFFEILYHHHRKGGENP